MNRIVNPNHTHRELAYRDQWLALLNKNGVRPPSALQVIEIPGIVVQMTKGEPAGTLHLEGAPGNVLMVNLSPVQDLRQIRDRRSFTSNMLHWDMTLMPAGVPSQWSWNNTCDRLDLIIAPHALGEEYRMEAIDRFLFRDRELESVCRELCRELSLPAKTDRLQVEILAVQAASVLQRNYATGSPKALNVPRGGLSHRRACLILEYVEANLGRSLSIRELAGIAQLGPYHFVRMFKHTLGLTPYQYVLERRIAHAKDLLQNSSLPLVEIGLSLGFSTQSHFTTAFHRLVGVTPKEFRKLVCAMTYHN